MIYLDNSATTRPYDEVMQAMAYFIKEQYGNPSSLHRMGFQAETGIGKARKSVAEALGTTEQEILFTGSGTEADNTAIFGAAYTNRRRRKKIVTTTIEHPAVLEACQRLQQDGYVIDTVGVDAAGLVDLAELRRAIDETTCLVSVMAVNNELGTVQPLSAIGKIVKEKGDILFHSDGVQAMGKIPLDLNDCRIDMMTFSAHKIHGPKGVGALFLRKGTRIEPLVYGGGQESGMRGGTENTPGIIGFGKAVEIQSRNQEERNKTIGELRRYLLDGIRERIGHFWINSPELTYYEGNVLEGVSSPSILNVSFSGCRGEVLLHALEEKNIYVSTGAACSSKKKGSHVLTAAGFSAERIESALRFSLCEFNTIEEMEVVISSLAEVVEKMRGLKRRTDFGI